VENAVIMGAGSPNGLGGALARRFAKEDLNVIVSGRNLTKIQTTVEEIHANGGSAEAVAADVTCESDLDQLFTHINDSGKIAAVMYNAGNNAMIPFEKLTAKQFENFWRVGCYGAFLAAQRAIPILKSQGHGSLIFTGASGSLRGKPEFAHFASAKAALRNLSQSLAREFGPEGIHVAHVIIDGVINGESVRNRFPDYLDQLGDEGALEPNVIADTFWAIHSQHRTAWTHELDLRPFREQW